MSSFNRAGILSQHVSSQIHTTVQRADEELPEDIEVNELSRNFYLSVIENTDWKDQLLSVITKVKDTTQIELDMVEGANENVNVVSDVAIEDEGVIDYTLYVGSNETTGEYNIGDCFIIGVKNGVDVSCNSSTVSRVYAFVFVTSTKIVILDYFSLGGTVCTSRSGNTSLPKSTSNDGRRPMIFDLNEAFTIKLSDRVTVKFSTRHCVICLTAPREMRFNNCGHGVVCNSCERSVEHCPICRVATGKNAIVSHCMKTYVS